MGGRGASNMAEMEADAVPGRNVVGAREVGVGSGARSACACACANDGGGGCHPNICGCTGEYDSTSRLGAGASCQPLPPPRPFCLPHMPCDACRPGACWNVGGWTSRSGGG